MLQQARRRRRHIFSKESWLFVQLKGFEEWKRSSPGFENFLDSRIISMSPLETRPLSTPTGNLSMASFVNKKSFPKKTISQKFVSVSSFAESVCCLSFGCIIAQQTSRHPISGNTNNASRNFPLAFCFDVQFTQIGKDETELLRNAKKETRRHRRERSLIQFPPFSCYC